MSRNVYKDVLDESTLHLKPAYVNLAEKPALGFSEEAYRILDKIVPGNSIDSLASANEARKLVLEVMSLSNPIEKRWLMWYLNCATSPGVLRHNYIRNFVESKAIDEGWWDSIKQWSDDVDLHGKYTKFEQATEFISNILSMISAIKGIFSTADELKNSYAALKGVEDEMEEMAEIARKRGGKIKKKKMKVAEAVSFTKLLGVLKIAFALVILVLQFTKIIKTSRELRDLFGVSAERAAERARTLKTKMIEDGKVIDMKKGDDDDAWEMV